MSMEITNNYGNYITGYANAAKRQAVPRVRTKKKKE